MSPKPVGAKRFRSSARPQTAFTPESEISGPATIARNSVTLFPSFESGYCKLLKFEMRRG